MPTVASAKSKTPASPAAKLFPTPPPRTSDGPVTLLVSTAKGLFSARSDKARESWKFTGPTMLGAEINHVVSDPRDNGKTWLMGASTGHMGPTVFRSTDKGKTWVETTAPPKFKEGAKRYGKPISVQRAFWLTPGHASQPNVWYLGTVPLGLFRSEDAGNTWASVDGFNYHKDLTKWSGDFSPGGPITHSVIVDPRNPSQLYLGLSGGGCFESPDAGKSWTPLNKGVAMDFAPPGEHEYGHDPHCMQIAPSNPDRLYMQNHCGIYRLDRPETRWERIGNNMPKEVGDIGFPVQVHPRNADIAWVLPMNGTMVWPRTSPDGKPASYMTRDAGKSWKRLDKGLPRANAFHTVYRQGFAGDCHNPAGLYFGTSSGEVWASNNEGKSWDMIASHLPRILAVEVA